MTTLQAVQKSIHNLNKNKKRSFLTMLGIIIGVFSVVLVMSVGAGAQSLIVNQIASRGTDQLAILAGASDEKGPPAQALGIVITTLTREDGEALLDRRNVSHLSSITGYISGNDVLQWQNQERTITYTGTMHGYEAVENITMDQGRFFSNDEDLAGEHVMVLGSSIAEEIFGNNNPIGQQVKLKRVQFRVIGVMEPKGSNFTENVDDAVIIPLTVAQEKLLGVDHVSFLRAEVTDEQYLDQTIEEIRQTLIERHGEEDFSVRNITDALTIIQNITDAMKFFLVAIAAIALFVGGVGIMNIMLIAVKEKTREIGLRKAVGAKKSDIKKQFLIETILLTTIGSSIGLLLGILVAYAIAQVVQSLGYDYSFILSFPTIIIAFVIAGIIGFIFGFIPARQAADLNPIDALRYE